MGIFLFSTLNIFFFAVLIFHLARLQKQVMQQQGELDEKHKILQTQHKTILDQNAEIQELNADLCEADDERDELRRDLENTEEARRRTATKLIESRRENGLPVRIHLVDSREITPGKGVKPGFSSMQN